MVERKDVELLIRAKDLSSKPLKDVAASLDQISASLAKQVEAARKGEVSYQELATSFKEVEQAGRALAQQQGLIDRFTKLSSQSERLVDKVRESSVALRDFRASLEGNATVTNKQEAALGRLERAYAKAQNALRFNQERLQRVRESLESAGVDTRDLASAQQQIVTSASQAGQAATTLSTAMSGYARSAREAAQATKAAAQLDSFRNLATQANEAVASAQRFASATGQIRTASSGFARSLVEIADPAAVARSTLAGLEEQVRDTAQVVAAINGPVRNYSETLLQLSAAQKAAERSGRLIDSFQEQTQSLRAARAEFVAARAQVRDYAAQVAAANGPNEELARKLKDAETRLAAASRQYRAYADAARDTQTRLKEAGVDTARLDDAQKRLTATVRQSADATKRLNDQFSQFGSAGRGGAGLFGLSPYAIQNLGFQVNDFFTQIASGTPVTQAFAQQFGQVVQVFGPGAWSAVSRWIPLLGGLSAALVVVVSTLGRLNQESSAVRNFAANLSLLAGGSGAGVTPQQLVAIAREVERLGFKFDDARAAAVKFLRDGLAPANIATATEAAARLSRVLGIDVADAVKLVSDASRGGSEAMLRLQEAGVRFTQAERDALAAAAASSNEFERQQQVLAILAQRFREADEQGLGPWQRAVIAAQNVWRGFLDELGRTTVFQGLKGALDAVAGALQNLRSIGQVAARTLISAFLPVITVVEGLANGLRSLGVLPQRAAGAAPASPAAPSGPTGTSPVGGDTIAEQRAQTEATRRELEIIRDDERRTRREREAAARRLFRIEVDSANEGASAATRAYLVQLRLLDFRKKLDDEAARSGREAAAAVRRDFQAIQQDVQNTIRVRDETIRGIQEDVAAGAITPAEAIERIQQAAQQAQPALARLADEARRFRDANSGDVIRRAQADALAAQAERQAGSLGSRAGVRQVITQQQSEVQRLVQERQQFVQTQDALVNQNAVTQTDAESRIAEFYARTNDELVRQIDLLQQAAEAARANGDISDAAYRQIAASVDLYRANLERVDPAITRLRNTIEQGFVQAISTAFNTAAEAFGNFIAGVGTLEEAFDQAGKAALQFFADFLKAIAQAIIQQQALIAVKMISAAIGGVFHGGGVVGSGNRSRQVSPYWFANAPRYHSGGVVGLKPDEQAAILQRGEEVLAKDDPRNVLNGGGRPAPPSAAAATPIKNVLAVGDDEIAKAMSGAAGEQVVLSILRRNISAVRTLVRA